MEAKVEAAKMRETLTTFLQTIDALARTCRRVQTDTDTSKEEIEPSSQGEEETTKNSKEGEEEEDPPTDK